MEELGLGEVTHTRKSKLGAKPGITTEEVLDRSTKTVSKFKPPVRSPTKEETRRMFSLALESLILTTMDNHMYSFNTDIRLQDEGGSIGNTLTCALAVLFMVYWSRGFKSKLSLATEDFPQFYLKMFRYYMDDGNLGSTALPPGSRLIDGKIRIVESEVEPDKNIPSDIRTSALVRDVGN